MTGIAGEHIPLFRPLIEDDAIAAISDVLRSGWLGLGPKTGEFERAFARYVDMPFCVGTSSCSGALQLALRLLDLSPGAEVITTPLTFVAVNQIILQEGLRPAFADVDPTTGNISADSVASLLSEATGAVLLVHYGGYPCDLDEHYALARAGGVPVIEDCAHACGAVYKGRRIGSHGDLHAFSFHAIKNLPMGEGGALTLRSGEHDARLRRLRRFGIDLDTYERASGPVYRWDYAVTELGFKLYLDDLHAAIGLVQLQRLEANNTRLARLAARYRRGLEGVPGIELLREEDDRRSSHHLFCVLADDRDVLLLKLGERGIHAGVHYRPSYDYPLFEGGPLPGVESFWRRAISLPMHLHLTDEQVDRIVFTIAEGW